MTPSTSPYLHTAPPLRRVMLQVAAATLPGVLVLALRLLRALPAGATDATDATDTADDGERERTASAPGPLAGTLLLIAAVALWLTAHPQGFWQHSALAAMAAVGIWQWCKPGKT